MINITAITRALPGLRKRYGLTETELRGDEETRTITINIDGNSAILNVPNYAARTVIQARLRPVIQRYIAGRERAAKARQTKLI